MFSIRAEDEITPLITDMSATIGDVMSRLAKETAEVLTPFLQQQAPLGQHFGFDGTSVPGGELRASLNWSYGLYGAKLQGAKQGEYVIGGTRPHEIRPATRSALAFFWTRARQGVTFGHVAHPGSTPNDFRWKAIEQASDEMAIKELTERIMTEWIAGGGV